MSQAPHLRSTLTLSDTLNAVSVARLHTEDILPKWGVPPDIVETARLLVSELVTNAVQHPQGGNTHLTTAAVRNTAHTVELTLESLMDGARVSVWDSDSRMPLLKEAGVEAESGRGVFIIAMMSRAWGCRTAVNRPGKVVWAEVGLVPAGRVVTDETVVHPPGRAVTTEPGVPGAREADPDRANEAWHDTSLSLNGTGHLGARGWLGVEWEAGPGRVRPATAAERLRAGAARVNARSRGEVL
ncbi:ATP-binding protein [Streptomyces californicus]|uniref:ATP-binding protein n=1 Tax=Streptomyces californicus TaxID=67351 RepID=UPI0036B0A6BC